MSQPAVSQHIRALEAQFEDVRLFRRVGQQMLLTHAGEELLDLAREIVGLTMRCLLYTSGNTHGPKAPHGAIARASRTIGAGERIRPRSP